MGGVAEVLEAEASSVERARALLADERPDLGALDAIARHLLERMRRRGPLSAVDGWLRSEREEILDDPAIDPAVRERAMQRLERLTESSGAHLLFARAIDSALGDVREPHIYEVAAGTGGLARAVGERLRRRRPGLRWTISDRDERVLAPSPSDPDWLRAETRDLRAPGPLPEADLFLCVQAAHHLPPGLVSLLLHRGAAAPCGLLLIDVHRGPLVAGLAAVAASVLARDRIVTLDGVQSARRAFIPAELALLARTAGLRVKGAGPLGPAYLQLSART